MTPEVANHLLILATMRGYELARQHVMASNLPGRADAVPKIEAEIRVNDAAMDALRPLTLQVAA
jgi:hypothetical protein